MNMKGGLAGLMKQAQQMQENMKRMQEQLATVEVEGQAGAGMAKVVTTRRCSKTSSPPHLTTQCARSRQPLKSGSAA